MKQYIDIRKYKLPLKKVLTNSYPKNSKFIICKLGSTGDVLQEQYICEVFITKNESGQPTNILVHTVDENFINCELDYYDKSWCIMSEYAVPISISEESDLMTKEELAQNILQELFDSREFIENDYYPVIQASKILEIAHRLNIIIKE